MAVVAAMALVVFALPATAAVHEIAGMHCAQNGNGGNPFPPGISGGSATDNFAQPLFAIGFIESIEPYAGDGVNGPGVLISFNFDHPASKLAAGGGDPFFVGDGTYLVDFVHDGSYTNCKAFQ